MDTGNFYWYGHPLEDLYGIFARFAARVFHTHCKNIKYPEDRRQVRRPMGWEYGKYNCPIYDGDVDFKRIVQMLRQANYAGDLCVENESLDKFPPGERAQVLKREVQMLKDLAAA